MIAFIIHATNLLLVLEPNFSLLPNDRIVDWSKLKEFAGDNFKFDENGRMFYKRVENTVGKEEIAGYEQFLHFPHCFQKTCSADT